MRHRLWVKMINLGTLLRKPGESIYSIHRRLLIANQSIKLDFKQLNGQLLQSLKNHGLNTKNKNFNTFQLIEINELKNLKSNIPTELDYHIGGQSSNYKTCFKCLSIGYDTKIYDFDWMSICPIHTEKLDYKCPKCNQFQPEVDKIYRRECEICGIKLDVKKIGDSILQPNTHYEIFRQMSETLKKSESFSTWYPLLSGSYRTSRPKVSIPYTTYSVSVMYALHMIDKKSLNNFTQFGMPFFECSVVKFKLKKEKSVSHINLDKVKSVSEVQKLNLNSIKVNVSKIFYKFLQKNSPNHKISTCEIDFHMCHLGCAWVLWKAIVFNEFEVHRSKEFYLRKTKDLFDTIWTSDLKLPEFVSHIEGDNRHENHNKRFNYRIPFKITKLIFEIDLYTTANIVYNFVNCNLNEDGSSKFGINSCFQRYITKYSNYKNFAYCPFVTSIKNNSATLVYPKGIFDDFGSNKVHHDLYLMDR